MASGRTYPGVYVEELPSGVKTVTGVATALTAFVGRARRGPVDEPVRIHSFSDFERVFGGLWAESKLGFVVQDYFTNGGSQAIVVRVLKPNEIASQARLPLAAGKPLVLRARDAGPSSLVVSLTPDSERREFQLTVRRPSPNDPDGEVLEQFSGLSLSAENPSFVGTVLQRESAWIEIAPPVPEELAAEGVTEAFYLHRARFELTAEGQPGKKLVLQAKDVADAAIVVTDDGDNNQKFGLQLGTLETVEQTELLVPGKAPLTPAEGEEPRVRPPTTSSNKLSQKYPEEQVKPIGQAAHESDKNSDTKSGNENEVELTAGNQKLTVLVNVDGLNRPFLRVARGGEEPEQGYRLQLLDFVPLETLEDLQADETLGKQIGQQAKMLTLIDRETDLRARPDLADVPRTPTDQQSVLPDRIHNRARPLPGDEKPKTGLYALEKADLFTLLCVPQDDLNGEDYRSVITAAAAYCERRRAMLIIDAPRDWDDKAKAVEAMRNPAAQLGTDSPNAAVYFPWIEKRNPLEDNRVQPFPPSGALAGLYARTDAASGVWKAPAGTAAGLVGAVRPVLPLTNDENGELNPLGCNCLRALPPYGTVAWGARTLAGNDQKASPWKNVPVRRLALFLEESLFRATKWVVFEPNDEPLWSQIRLNLGAFMHDLFRQGAFQGATPREAYFVKCDHETTTQSDIDKGIVNIVVGFAPLKPAEFVVLKIQQISPVAL